MTSYITKEFLENSLLEKLGKIDIINFSFAQANIGGDNYTSEIYRTEVEYQACDGKTNKISLIVKIMIESEGMADAMQDFEPFAKENEMYLKFLPEFEKTVDEKFSPIIYNIINKPHQIFVMEDLKASGHSIPDRIKGLDIDHCKIVLEKLAKFHAVSMVLADANPTIYDKNFYFGFFHPRLETKGGPFLDHYTDNMKMIIDSLKSDPEMNSIVKKLEAIEPNFVDKIFTCVKQNSKYRVLNHGDAWTNNIMFKYNDAGKPCDAAFIDFQDSFYSSPGIDLNYFMITSPNFEVQKNNSDELLKHYYNFFSDTLESLKFSQSKIPTYDNLITEYKNFGFYGFMNVIGILPLIKVEKDPNVKINFESLAGKGKDKDDSLRKFQIQGPSFQGALKCTLRILDENGVLDN